MSRRHLRRRSRLARTEEDERHLTGLVADVAFHSRGYGYSIDLPGFGQNAVAYAIDRSADAPCRRVQTGAGSG